MVNIKSKLREDFSLSDLSVLYRKEKNPKVKERLLAMIHIKKGKTTRQVGDIISKGWFAVAFWVRRFNNEGPSGLKDRQKSGRPKRIANDDFSKIRKDLSASPEEFGYNQQFWTPKLLKIHIEKTYQTQYTDRHTLRIIRKFDYTLIKPRTSDIRKNPADKDVFREALKKTSRKPKNPDRDG